MLTFALLAAIPVPVDLERLSIPHARQLDGRTAVVTFLVMKPPCS